MYQPARLWLADALLTVGAGCRWPLGETSSESFHYCGDPRDPTHDCPSYCKAHRAMAYLRPDETQEERDAAEKRKELKK